MKKIVQLLFLSLIIVLGACNKDEINNTDTKVGISRVTFYPLVKIKGEKYIYIQKGGTYTEAGVDATEAGAPTTVVTTGTPNTAVAGVYSVVYTATNKDGFTAADFRIVTVYDTDAAAAAVDLSGSYKRSAPGNAADGQIMTFTKKAPGVYFVDNPGGAVGVNVQVIVINPTLNVVKIPTQLIGIGNPFGSSSETYTPLPTPQIVWRVVNAGYGTGLRTFNKI
jgi:hypothetical protein